MRRFFRGFACAAIIGLFNTFAYSASAIAAEGGYGGCDSVYMDVGHSAKRFGAMSARGKTEYEFNKRFTIELADKLVSAGKFRIDIISGMGKNLSLAERVRKIKSLESGVFLSLHHDSVQPRYLSEWFYDGRKRRYSDMFTGYSVFVSARAPAFRKSVVLGQYVGQALFQEGFSPTLHHAEKIPGENRPLLNADIGLYRFDGLAVLKNAKIPAILIEVGIIVNRAEEEKLNDPAHRARIQDAILIGLKRFCSST